MSDTFTSFVDAHLSDRTGDFINHSSVICLASKGSPVVFVSGAFEDHTGYSHAEVVGRSLSILQGPETEPEAVARFRELISTGQAGAIRITNYRKNGEKFVHECEVRPVRDSEGRLSHMVAIQRPV